MAQAVAQDDRVARIPLARRGGLDPEAVRVVVRELEDELEASVQSARETYGELSRTRDVAGRLEGELTSARAELRRYQENEAAVGNALVTANRVAGELREQARAEAEGVLESARTEAQRILEDARERGAEVVREATASAASVGRVAREGLSAVHDQIELVRQQARVGASTLRDAASRIEASAETLEQAVRNLPIDSTRVALDFGESGDLASATSEDPADGQKTPEGESGGPVHAVAEGGLGL